MMDRDPSIYETAVAPGDCGLAFLVAVCCAPQPTDAQSKEQFSKHRTGE